MRKPLLFVGMIVLFFVLVPVETVLAQDIVYLPLVSSGDSDTGDIPPTNSESADIGPTGGVIELANGSQLTIPEGALSTTETISFTYLATGPTIEEDGLAYYTFEPSGVEFAKPAIFKMAYSDSDVFDEDYLNVAAFNETTLEWEFEAIIAQDKEKNEIDVAINHFSTRVTFADEPLYLALEIPVKYLRPGDILVKMSADCDDGSAKWIPGHTAMVADPLGADSDGKELVESQWFGDTKRNGCLMAGGVRRRTFKDLIPQSEDLEDLIEASCGFYVGARRNPATTAEQGILARDFALQQTDKGYNVLSQGNGGDECYSCVGLVEDAYEFAGADIIPEAKEFPFITPIQQFKKTVPVNSIEVKVGETVEVPVFAIVKQVRRLLFDNYKGDNSILEVSHLPTGATFDNEVFKWTPTNSQAGLEHHIEFSATADVNGTEEKKTATLKINVSRSDQPPTATPTPTVTTTPEPSNGGTTVRVSVASDGSQGNDESLYPSISADGRFVVFTSDATNLVANDTNGTGDVFVQDRTTGKTTRVSVASDSSQANDHSYSPLISADGRFVIFQSDATNLVANDTNGVRDSFAHDRTTGETTRVLVTPQDGQEIYNAVYPSISSDGRYLAFSSYDSNLVANDTNGTEDVFVYDRTTGETTRVSVASDGTEGEDYSNEPVISADGRFVAFSSVANNLGAGDTNGFSDVFVHDRTTGATTRVSVNSDGVEGDHNSHQPSISDNGQYVAFTSGAFNLAAGAANASLDVFVHDRNTGETTHVSVSLGGNQGNDYPDSYQPSISADGRLVAFTSHSYDLVEGDTNETWDIFVHDRWGGGDVPTPTPQPTATATPAPPTATPQPTATFTPVPPTPTATLVANQPPNIPSNPSPEDGATISTAIMVLIWDGGDPDGDRVTNTVYLNGQVVCEGPATTCIVSELGAGQLHEWQVQARDEHGSLSVGPTWRFSTNQPPNYPSNPSPEDGATISTAITVLIWDGGDPDGDEVTNTVYLNGQVVCEGPATTCIVSELGAGQLFEWQVQARDEHGISTEGPIWSFSTNRPPFTPANPSPTIGATVQPAALTLSWSGGDPDGDEVTYDVWLNTVLRCENTTSTSCLIEGLARDGLYIWNVLAEDGEASTLGPTWLFYTEP